MERGYTWIVTVEWLDEDDRLISASPQRFDSESQARHHAAMVRTNPPWPHQAHNAEIRLTSKPFKKHESDRAGWVGVAHTQAIWRVSRTAPSGQVVQPEQQADSEHQADKARKLIDQMKGAK